MKRLVLRKETLVELTDGELVGLVGASGLPDCRPTTTVLTYTQQTLTMCPNYYCTGTC